jgi:hypothetical protein
VISKVEIVEHVNNVVRLIGVLFAQLIENANLNKSLMMETLLVTNNFDCHILIGFVIQCPDDLTKATLADHFEYLVAIADVIVNDLKGECLVNLFLGAFISDVTQGIMFFYLLWNFKDFFVALKKF